MTIQDFKMIQSNNGQYDMEINLETADFSSVEGFETAISVQLDTDKRVDKTERPKAQDRKGWIGDVLNTQVGYQIGSRLHLKQQARDTPLENNETAAEAKKAIEYLVAIRAAKEVTAGFLGNTIEGKIVIDENDVSRYSRLWRVTANGTT